jgi:addiction module RelE/StbE family toxin
MRIIYRDTKIFIKHLKKLPKPTQIRVRDAIELFKVDPKTRSLRNHRLTGQMRHVWSISAGGDIRIHYTKHINGEIIIFFVDVGTHSQLY